MVCLELLAADEPLQHRDGRLADFDQRLVNGRQGRRHLGGIHDIIEADHAHLVRDADIALVEDLVDAGRLRVVAGKDRGWLVVLNQQMTGLFDSVAQQVGALADQGRINGDAGALERLAVAGQARAGGREMEREGDDADAPERSSTRSPCSPPARWWIRWSEKPSWVRCDRRSQQKECPGPSRYWRGRSAHRGGAAARHRWTDRVGGATTTARWPHFHWWRRPRVGSRFAPARPGYRA